MGVLLTLVALMPNISATARRAVHPAVVPHPSPGRTGHRHGASRLLAHPRRAVLSSYLGSVIEYYDFLLYATASAVVFNKVFFSNLDPLVGTVASFGTLATGYFARPLGGIVFGHFGDRIGRKKMLILSMPDVGVGSTLIGLLPTYDQIGVGPDPADAPARRAGHRDRRRVGRRGADVRRARHLPARAVGQLHQRRRPTGMVLSTWRWP